MPPRQHAERPQRFNDIGIRGRMTGVSPPKNAPRDSFGNELPEAYFRHQFDEPANRSSSARAASTGPSVPPRKRERPDLFNDFGDKGRKTGVKAPPVRRDAAGFENPADFFLSPPSRLPPEASTVRSKVNRSALPASPARRSKASQSKQFTDPERTERVIDDEPIYGDDPFADGFGGGYDDYDNGASSPGDSDDMQLDDGSSLTPSAFMPVKDASPRIRSAKSKGKLPQTSLSPSVELEGDIVDFASDYEKGSSADEEGSSAEEVSRLFAEPSNEPSWSHHGESLDDDHFGLEELDEYTQSKSALRGRKRKQSGKAAPSGRVSKSKKSENSARPAPSTTAAVVNDDDEEFDHNGNPVRRSKRQRLPPVDYWRNERVIYHRRPSGIEIEKVVRLPKAPAGPLSQHHRKRGHSANPVNQRNRAGSRFKSETYEEEGVDDLTEPDGLVLGFDEIADAPSEEEIKRRIAFTPKMFDLKPSAETGFGFQKIFTDEDYLAGGFLLIRPGKTKPLKPSRDNAYIFYCMEGSVSVQVHRTTFAIGSGAAFFVPRGNMYSITATSKGEARLFFTQARRAPILIEEEEESASDSDHGNV